MMKQWTIGKRIHTGFATLVGLLLLMGGISWYLNRTIGRQVMQLTTDSLPGLKLSSALQAETLKYRILILKHVISTNNAERVQLDQQTDAQAQALVAVLGAYQKTISAEQDRQLFARIEPLWKVYNQVAQQIRALSSQHRQAEAVALLNSASGAYADYEKAVWTWCTTTKPPAIPPAALLTRRSVAPSA